MSTRANLVFTVALLLSVSVHAQNAPAADHSAADHSVPDHSAPDQSGRKQLTAALDNLAAEQTASRRAEIAAITTRRQAEARQAKVRATMLRLIGPLPAKTPLNAQVIGENKLPGIRIQKILFDSQPNFHVTALIYLPDPLPLGRLPAIVIAPGHGATGKASDFASATTFAHNGFAVLSYDPIGQGERLQYPDPASSANSLAPAKSLATRPTGEHGEAGLQPVLIGESLARYMLWDGMRAVDYLLTRPEVDAARIGAYGCSGGGAMTALLGGLDPRIAAVGTACYITSFDTLLPAIGPQDGEQSTPGWIAAGLDFADWAEVAAPRPYAIIATASDMFPWAGAKASAAEARRFYALFDPASTGTPTGNAEPPTPAGPVLNPDTPNAIPLTAKLQFIAGAGGHGNLRPLQAQIVSFFLQHLAHSTAAPILPPPPAPGTSPFALPAGLPKDALQVTSTGQVATAYPDSATVFSLNLAHARALPRPAPQTLTQLQTTIRTLLAIPPSTSHDKPALFPESNATVFITPASYTPSPPHPPHSRFPAVLILSAEPLPPALPGQPFSALRNRLYDLPESGKAALILSSRPSPPGSEELKSSLLGPFYLLGLRAELTGRSLLGLRVQDVLDAVAMLASRPDIDPAGITAEASGHEALVLLHAAVLDPRLKHITLHNMPPSYAVLLANPLPQDAPQDIVPGVLLHYDTPDLIHLLGTRVTIAQ